MMIYSNFTNVYEDTEKEKLFSSFLKVYREIILGNRENQLENLAVKQRRVLVWRSMIVLKVLVLATIVVSCAAFAVPQQLGTPVSCSSARSSTEQRSRRTGRLQQVMESPRRRWVFVSPTFLFVCFCGMRFVTPSTIEYIVMMR